LCRSGDRELSDDRILGCGEFAERIIKEAEAKFRNLFSSKDDPEKINELIAKICKIESISIADIKAGCRRRQASRVLTHISIGFFKTHGVPLAEVARHIGVSTSTVSEIITPAKN